jgi:hypothetical protein
MKNTGLIIILGLLLTTAEALSQDTTLIVNDKRIELSDKGDRIKVKVYEQTEKDGIVEDEMIFEGHYKDGKSYENRKHIRSINIPIPTWNKDFDAHWAGVGMGFANFADKGMHHFNDIDGISLRSGSSLEYNLNFWEESFLLSSRAGWAVVTGAGLRWSRYRIDGNRYFMEADGLTSLHPLLEDLNYTASKLNITSLTIPLLLEWQNRRKGSANVFISAGIEGIVKTISSSKVSYKDGRGKKQTDKMDSGMNLRPVTMDLLVQAGFDWLGIYARYSPLGLFESGKGPVIYPVSIGLILHL